MGLHLLRQWARLGHAERRLAVQAWLLLGLCRALVWRVSLDRLVSWHVPIAGVREVSSDRLAGIVASLAIAHPCRPRCLEQALVVVWALRAGGARPELVLGRASGAPFRAHAWVRLGGRVLLDRGAAGRCDELHAFIAHPAGG